MRIQDILRTIQENFYLALILLAVLTVVLGITYFLIYKKVLKGDKKLSKRRIVICFCLIGYLTMVAGVTFIGRGIREYGDSNLHFLSTYRAAWNSFSSVAWMQIILNIIMLTPLGILLPIVDKRFYKFKWTFGAAFLLTLSIETMQLITGYGVFDLDDIFNNTIGAIIGYGIVMAIMTFMKGKENRANKFKRSIIYLIPLVLVITSTIVVVGVYNAKEFGNLFIAYNYKINMKDIDLSWKIRINNDTKEVFLSDNNKYSIEKVPIYKAEVYDRGYGEELFKDLLKHQDTDINEEIEVDPYSDMAIYWSRGEPSYNMSFYYNGGKYDYRDFSSFDEGVERIDIDKKIVLEKLAEIDITIPQSAIFIKPDEAHQVGIFQWTVENHIDGDYITNGVLSAEYYNDNTLKGIGNNIVKYKKVRDVKIKSRKEIYKDIEEGKFKFHYNSKKIEKLNIEDMKLDYFLDTKGYYQPIYAVEVKINGKEDLLLMPAL